MNELPYFKMYPKDWLLNLSVIEMSTEQQGAYFRLLCHDWVSNGIPTRLDLCAKLAGIDDVSDIVKNHFTIEINGKLCNKKLFEQKTALKKNQKECIKAIRKRWDGRNTDVLPTYNGRNTNQKQNQKHKKLLNAFVGFLEDEGLIPKLTPRQDQQIRQRIDDEHLYVNGKLIKGYGYDMCGKIIGI